MTPELDYEGYWNRAVSWEEYLASVEKNRQLWEGVYRTARIPEEALSRAAELRGPWRLIVLTEDWCGDASNILPVIARFVERAPGFELGILGRDENPELMDRYLTNGSRSIPMVIILDESLQPVGSWGPRPAELQEFVLTEKRAGERPTSEIYADTRRWYARDKGETTLRELLDTIEAAVVKS